MKMQPIKSSNLKAVGYDAESKTLRVEFGSGGAFDYAGIDQKMFDKFLKADSQGKFFHAHIKGKGGKRVEETDDE
ncbi:KTSC domain-containing protein [Ferrovibrio sp.]|uniref:KTSC domain-containing protein n=1 Tax=Ferrovibrio sp. TaxID=1917215 RepID=UPI00311F686F